MIDWEKRFTEEGAFWFHDGNPKRPYARLTSGKISNGFFNGGKIAEEPWLLSLASKELVAKAREWSNDFNDFRQRRPYVTGAAMGAIQLASFIAEAADCKTAYAEKTADGSLAFNRFSFEPRTAFVMCEDTITTGGTLAKLEAAAEKASEQPFTIGMVLALCNRSGLSEVNGMKIIALIDKPMRTWDEGENPFTSDGKESVPSMRPKGKENWHALTREY